MPEALWEVYALKYATHDRLARENFIGGDPHDSSPMPLDYFIWVLRQGARAVVVDTGFDEASGNRRGGRKLLNSPIAGLQALGIHSHEVQDVIVTHMHYDHAGNHHDYPNARYHVQAREMAFCTGPYMTHKLMRMPFDGDDVAAMVLKLYGGRVVYHAGDSDFAPGVSLHLVGGHSDGLQMVRVKTRRGNLVLASDAAHYYANMDKELPYPFVFNVGDTLEGYRRARVLADSPDHIIPGHDPLVLDRYPAPLLETGPELKGWIARLD
jgi:glyoxylase-like metal-dependent hydrolase (beta-lactamase superfamily II)